MGELSPWHWAIVILIFVVLFGAKRLPDAARSLGRSARILKAELHGDAAKPAEPPAAQTPAAQTPAAQTPVAPTPVAPATVVTSDAAAAPAAEAPTTAPATAGVDPVVPPAPVQEQPQTAQR